MPLIQFVKRIFLSKDSGLSSFEEFERECDERAIDRAIDEAAERIRRGEERGGPNTGSEMLDKQIIAERWQALANWGKRLKEEEEKSRDR